MKYTMLIILVICVFSGLSAIIDESNFHLPDLDSSVFGKWTTIDDTVFHIPDGFGEHSDTLIVLNVTPDRYLDDNVYIGDTDITLGDLAKMVARFDSTKINTQNIIEYYELRKKIERLEARIDTLEKKIKVLEQAVEYEVMKNRYNCDDDTIDAIIEDLDEIWKEIFLLKYYKK